MPNRYTRDEVILIALNMVQLPNLSVHDAPNGVVQQDAFSIQWLQSALDTWHHLMPFSQTVSKVQANCTANSDSILMPADFILDVRNGLIVQRVPGDPNSYRRSRRMSLQTFINRQLIYQGAVDVKAPLYYCVSGDDNDVLTQRQTMLVTPTPTINTVCQLWYYKLPPPIEANQRPKVPDDEACIEYIRLRALEWAGVAQPGTAKKYTDMLISRYKASGLLNEPEDDEIPFDSDVYVRQSSDVNTYSWMGPV